MEEQLRAGVAALALDLTDEQIAQLLRYAGMLQKWGKVYNLTSRLSDEEVVTHHLLDSLAVINPLLRQCGSAPRVLDVGAGAGLPGVVIAIALPDVRVACVDAVAKKAAFVQQAAGTLGLRNLRSVHARVEDIDATYDVVTSRAFASLADFTRLTRQCLAENGVWLAMKGKLPEQEIAELPSDVAVFHVEQLQVPGLLAERCLLWLRCAPR